MGFFFLKMCQHWLAEKVPGHRPNGARWVTIENTFFREHVSILEVTGRTAQGECQTWTVLYTRNLLDLTAENAPTERFIYRMCSLYILELWLLRMRPRSGQVAVRVFTTNCYYTLYYWLLRMRPRSGQAAVRVGGRVPEARVMTKVCCLMCC